MTETAERLITAEEYLASDYGERFTELIDGRVVFNQPLIHHQAIVGRIHLALGNWVAAEAGRGFVSLPLATKIDEYNVLAPDLVWIAHEHLPPPRSKYMVHPPELVVEVRSPSTWQRDVGVKKNLYERHGVGELWLVDDRSTSVLVYRRSSEGAERFDIELELTEPDALTSPQLPGLALDLESAVRTGVLITRIGTAGCASASDRNDGPRCRQRPSYRGAGNGL